jgi:hypothetical protein
LEVCIGLAARKATGMLRELGSLYVATHRCLDARKFSRSSVLKGESEAMNESAGIDLNMADAELSIPGRKGISVDVAGRIDISFLSVDSDMAIGYAWEEVGRSKIRIYGILNRFKVGYNRRAIAHND